MRASLRLTGAEIHVGSESEPDNNRAISLRLYISAFTAVREVKSVCCEADLYSTAYDLTAKTETVAPCAIRSRSWPRCRRCWRRT